MRTNLEIAPLFNTQKYVKNLEKGYKLALDEKIKNDNTHDIEIWI